MNVPASPATTSRNFELAISEIHEHVPSVSVHDLGTTRDSQDDRFSVLACFFGTAALDSGAGPVFTFVAEIDECGQVGVCADNNIPASAAISSIGASAGYKFFSTETDAAVSARPRFHIDFDTVDESHRSRAVWWILLDAVDADLFAAFALALELDDPVDLGKEGEVSTQPDVVACVDLGPTLANEDVTRTDKLACKLLHAPTF